MRYLIVLLLVGCASTPVVLPPRRELGRRPSQFDHERPIDRRDEILRRWNTWKFDNPGAPGFAVPTSATVTMPHADLMLLIQDTRDQHAWAAELERRLAARMEPAGGR